MRARYRSWPARAYIACLVCIGCTAIERRQYASVTPVAAPPSGTSITGSSAETLRRDWPDASVDIQVSGSKGNLSFLGLLLPIFPLPSQNFDGPSPWVYLTVRPHSTGVAFAFDASAVVLEAPDGRRYRPLLLSEPRDPERCMLGPPKMVDSTTAHVRAITGAHCFQVAFGLPPATVPRYLLHIPRPLAATAAQQRSEMPSVGAAEMWTVCVRPRAAWEGDFAPFAPFFGPTWTFFRTAGRADFRDCPATPPTPVP